MNKYPWIVTLIKTSDGKYGGCGGTLIASKYVVTAAHCLFRRGIPRKEDDYVVRLGDHNMNRTGETQMPEKTIKIKRVFTHEDYKFKYQKNDIALLELAEEVDLNVYTPACIAKASDGTFEGMNAQVYGWGTTKWRGNLSDVLLEVNVRVVSNEVCIEAMQKKYPEYPEDFLDDGHLCAGGVEGEDSCVVGEEHITILANLLMINVYLG